MSARNYLPTTIDNKIVWLNNFLAYITNNSSELGMSSSEVLEVTDALNLALDAYALSSVAETRTAATIADTNAKLNFAIGVARKYAQQINNSPNTTDLMRAAIQITIRDSQKTPIPAPLSYPVITVKAATPLNHTLKFQDSEAILTKSKAKPFGAVAMELRQHNGATAPASPEVALFVGLITKSPFAVEQDPADVGQTAHYYGRWITARGLTGPWSALASMTIAA